MNFFFHSHFQLKDKNYSHLFPNNGQFVEIQSLIYFVRFNKIQALLRFCIQVQLILQFEWGKILIFTLL